MNLRFKPKLIQFIDTRGNYYLAFRLPEPPPRTFKMIVDDSTKLPEAVPILAPVEEVSHKPERRENPPVETSIEETPQSGPHEDTTPTEET